MTLRVILQIVPMGDEDNIREIGRLDIFNKGTIDYANNHRYGVIDLTPKQEGLFNATIHHQRADGAWELVYKVLRDLQIK